MGNSEQKHRPREEASIWQLMTFCVSHISLHVGGVRVHIGSCL